MSVDNRSTTTMDYTFSYPSKKFIHSTEFRGRNFKHFSGGGPIHARVPSQAHP